MIPYPILHTYGYIGFAFFQAPDQSRFLFQYFEIVHLFEIVCLLIYHIYTRIRTILFMFQGIRTLTLYHIILNGYLSYDPSLSL